MAAPGTGARRESLDHTKGGNENGILIKKLGLQTTLLTVNPTKTGKETNCLNPRIRKSEIKIIS